MITSIKILNTQCEVEARIESLVPDLRFQEFEIEFWKRLWSAATIASIRSGYAHHLKVAETKLEALRLLKIQNP